MLFFCGPRCLWLADMFTLCDDKQLPHASHCLTLGCIQIVTVGIKYDIEGLRTENQCQVYR